MDAPTTGMIIVLVTGIGSGLAAAWLSKPRTLYRLLWASLLGMGVGIIAVALLSPVAAIPGMLLVGAIVGAVRTRGRRGGEK